MVAQRPTARGWHEPVRNALIVIWVSILTLWMYHQALFFYCYPRLSQSTLEAANMVRRTVMPLWLACFLPALAVGLAVYAWSQRPLRDRLGSGVHCGLERLRAAQSHMTLCVALCLFVLNWRILYSTPMADAGWNRIGEPLTVFHWGRTVRWQGVGVLELQACIAAVAVGAMFLRAWELVRPDRGRRRNLLVLFLALSAAGLLAPTTGILYEMPSAIRAEVRDVLLDDSVRRSWILGGRGSERQAARVLSTYFETHDAQGRVLPWKDVQENELPDWDWFAPGADSWEPCEICQLPGVNVWTAHGLPLLIGEEGPPPGEGPQLVIEVPRDPTVSRLYEPGGGADIRTVPTAEIGAALAGAQWVVLKLDFGISMNDVLPLLGDLRDLGVRRVDLAVIPFGYRRLPSDSPRLTVDSGSGGATYEPLRSAEKRWRYFPPPLPGRRCDFFDCGEYWKAWMQWRPDPPGSLPESVTIGVNAETRYGEFVAVLQGAISGGARRIDVAMPEPGE